LLVFDKPAGLLATPIKGSRQENARDLLNAYLSRKHQEARTVHRIDRYTSGVLLFAKTRAAQAKLVEQFKAHSPRRCYWALARGHMRAPEGELRHYLRLIPRGFRQVVTRNAGEEGTLAISRYRLLERMPGVSLLEVELVTGLKNQIRVQLQACGHPVVGDRHYAPSEMEETEIDRQALHARMLGFLHPRTGRPVEFTAPLPPDFSRLIEKYRALDTSPR
jgi:23S rRNA pseudouridine1911/1915/1917 synthase